MLPRRHALPVPDPQRAGVLLDEEHSSTDAGASWHVSTPAEKAALTRIRRAERPRIAFVEGPAPVWRDPAHPGRRLLLANGAYSNAAGANATWRRVGRWRGAISFGRGAHVLLALKDGWLSRSGDDGRSWRRTRQAGIPDGGRLAGGSDGSAWVQFGRHVDETDLSGSVAAATDGRAAGWGRLLQTAGELLASAADPLHLFEVRGAKAVRTSSDGGVTWSDPLAPSDGGFMSPVGVDAGNTLYLQASRGTAASSRLVRVGAAGLDQVGYPGERVAVDPTQAGVLVSWQPDGEAWRSTDGGSSWRTVIAAPQGVRLGYPWMAFVAGAPGVAFGTGWGGDWPSALRSTDGGATWGSAQYPGVYAPQAVGDPATPGTLYALSACAARFDEPQGAIYRSADGGSTWSLWALTPYVDEATGLHVDPVAHQLLLTTRGGVFATSLDDAGSHAAACDSYARDGTVTGAA